MTLLTATSMGAAGSAEAGAGGRLQPSGRARELLDRAEADPLQRILGAGIGLAGAGGKRRKVSVLA